MDMRNPSSSPVRLLFLGASSAGLPHVAYKQGKLHAYALQKGHTIDANSTVDGGFPDKTHWLDKVYQLFNAPSSASLFWINYFGYGNPIDGSWIMRKEQSIQFNDIYQLWVDSAARRVDRIGGPAQLFLSLDSHSSHTWAMAAKERPQAGISVQAFLRVAAPNVDNSFHHYFRMLNNPAKAAEMMKALPADQMPCVFVTEDAYHLLNRYLSPMDVEAKAITPLKLTRPTCEAWAAGFFPPNVVEIIGDYADDAESKPTGQPVADYKRPSR